MLELQAQALLLRSQLQEPLPCEPEQPQDELLELNWSPALALELLRSTPALDMSSEGLRVMVREFTESAGCLIRRIQQGAPDAATALQRLQSARSRILEFIALIAVGEWRGRDRQGVTPLVDIVMRPLCGDDLPMPDERHWEWAVTQLQLEPEQEELVVALLQVWRTRVAGIAAQSDALLQECEDRASEDVGAQEERLKLLTSAQKLFELHAACFILALYGSLLTAQQVAVLMVSSWPFVPSMHVLNLVLCKPPAQQQQRHQQQQQPQGSPGTNADASRGSQAPGTSRSSGDAPTGTGGNGSGSCSG